MTSTPGPWAYDGVRVFSPAIEGRYRVRHLDGTETEHRRGLIALVYACGDGEREDNARLIAAAPELLAALHAVWRLAETLDIGTAEKALIRDLVYPAIDAARGPYPRVGTP